MKLNSILDWFGNPYGIFEVPELRFSQEIWYQLLQSDFSSDFTQNWILELNLRYFILLKTTSNHAKGPWDYEKAFYSKFMETIDGTLIFETENLALYKLF